MALPHLLSGSLGHKPFVASFDEIVSRNAAIARSTSPDADPSAGEDEVKKMWESFAEAEHGEVVSYCFGRFGNTGAALTVGYERRFFPPAVLRRPRLHVVLDLATAGEAADLVSRYERLRAKADQLLFGAEREHVARVLYDRVCRVIRIVDQMLALDQFKSDPSQESIVGASGAYGPSQEFAPASHSEDGKTATTRRNVRRNIISDRTQRIETALSVAKTEAVQAEELCNRAVRRGAMMAYFVGMLVGILIFTGLGVGLSVLLSHVEIVGFKEERFLTVFIAGAVGAIVSVMTRMSSEDKWLEYETARSYLRVLGMFRPLIGAIFGVALYFGIQSGVLEFIQPPKDPNAVFFFFAFIAFLAGFSERWASDVLVPIKQNAPEAGHPSAVPMSPAHNSP
jgi:hypothetical protein